MGFQLTGNSTVCLAVPSGKHERKYQADLFLGVPPAMESRHIGPAKLHSSDPLRASNVINYGMTISITVT